jgi:hypothetical protein
MKVTEAGIELDADFSVTRGPRGLELTVESRGGARGAPNERNTQYDDGLRVLLARLGERGARITDALVTSSTSLRRYPAEDDRRLHLDGGYPVRVADHNPDDLRRAFGRAMRKAARNPELTSSGNNNKRVTFDIDVPGAPGPADLEAELARGTMQAGRTPPAPPPGNGGGAGGRPRTAAAPRRQGYMADARKRKAVEDRAMAAARAHYEALGFEVEDVSGFSSFDLKATGGPGGAERHVEVKGTTGAGEAVELTIGEVNHARLHRDRMALFVLAGISLADGPDAPVATGGIPAVLDPWDVDAGTLTAKRFAYEPPAGP